MRRAALVGLLALGALTRAAGAGNYTPPPGDCCVQWSPHGTQIVFAGNRGQGLAVGVVAPTGAGERFVRGIPVGIRSPDWTHVAYIKYLGADWWLAVSRVDGSGERLLAKTAGGFAWSPDSSRLTFVAADRTLAVIGADGSGLVTVAPKPTGEPAWSPRGNRIAYVAGADHTSIRIVEPDGSRSTRVRATGSAAGPVWSPDGSRLAFWTSNGSTASLTVARIGVATVGYYEIVGSVTNGAIVWTPDGGTVYGAGGEGLVGIDLASGRRRTLVGITNAVFSPDGRLLAYAAGGECRDRVGIYIANAVGTTRRRITNSCSVFGTAGPDVLHGSFSQVVFGLGGDDTLYADDTYYYFDGNTLYGGQGNDTLVGGFGQDTLDGGPGNDALTGGPSADILVGGPGDDQIEGGGGPDTIYAVDGQRDRVTCGENGYNGRDTVYADQYDVVAKDCEIVHRIRR
jgi:RTX calcium-binding nonapeptide repeat (4 copies)/WD40-like Beta Propeller Repeat